jgi:hypothetical protein
MADSNDLPKPDSDELVEIAADHVPTVAESVASSGDAYSFGENLTYMIKDPKWFMKMLLGGLFGIIPIVNFVTAGYGLQVINNVRGDADPVLPEWGGNFGGMWVDGLKLFVIGLIYSIPVMIIAMLTGVPAAIMGSMSEGSDGMGFMAVGTACLGSLLTIVVGAFILFWTLGAITNFAVKDGDFGAAFQFGKIWDIIKANMGKMVLAVAAAVVASFIVGILSSVLAIIPCIGWIIAWVISFVAAFYVLLVISYTLGHIAKTV